MSDHLTIENTDQEITERIRTEYTDYDIKNKNDAFRY